MFRRIKKGDSAEKILKDWDMRHNTPEGFMTVTQAAKYYNVSEISILNWLKKNKITAKNMAKNGTFQKSKMIQICRADIERLADQWITGRNAVRDREIIKRRLIDGITYERLAEDFELSDRQIKNIVYKRQEAIYKHVPK